MATTRYFKKGTVKRTFNCDGDLALVTIEIGGRWVSNPTVAMLASDGWEEYTPEPVPPYQPTREEKINADIRAKYSLDDELMIQRKRETDKEAFDEYYAFVESVIAKYPEEV